MGFYGMLLGATVLFTIVVLTALLGSATELAGLSTQFGLYTNIQTIEAFERMVASTQPQSNSTEYGAWLAAMRLCGGIDGVNISSYGGAVVVSTTSRPVVYAIMQKR